MILNEKTSQQMKHTHATALKINLLQNDMCIYIYTHLIYANKITNLPHERPWFGTTGSFLKECITWGTPHLEHHHETFP